MAQNRCLYRLYRNSGTVAPQVVIVGQDGILPYNPARTFVVYPNEANDN